MAVEVGQEAPDFTLKDQTGLRGHAVELPRRQGRRAGLLPVHVHRRCQGELCELRDDNSSYEKAGLQVLAVSCDSRHAQAKWAEQQGFTFPVLSDFWPHGEVAKAYGVFNDALGCANRATFIIGKDGKVVDTFATDSLATSRDKSSYEAALTKI